jgi:serine/threonine-protein kinase
VYRAWDPDLERFIAIKLIHPVHGMKDELKARVLREGRAIARVTHPNVVSVLGVEVHDGHVGLCMELVNGKTLDEIVRTQGTLGAQEATMIGQCVCRALSSVHAANLVHRDIKARNVMRAEGGRIVLMDFGAGDVLRDKGEDTPGALHGTPIYMAPEALAGRPGSVATDIYSTGVLLYFLVTGRYPFEGATTEEVRQAHVRGQRRLLTDRRPDLPAPFVRAVERAMDPDPARRHESAARLLMDLMDAGEQVQPEPGPSPARDLSAFVARNGPRAFSFGLATVAALLVLGFFNSFTYSFTFGLESADLNEGPLDWLRWGAKSMVAPLALMIVVSIVILLSTEVVALVRRVSTVADQKFRDAGASLERAVLRIGLTPPSALACVLLVLALTFDWWVIVWRFPELLSATMTPIDTASTAMLARLAPSNYDEQTAYRQVLSLGVLGLAFGLFKVVRLSARRGERVRALLIGALVAMTVFNVVLLDLPYRILWWNDGERVAYEGTPCHVLASRGDSYRLFCASRSPRSLVVPSGDPRLVRSHTQENIFTPFSRPGAD